MEKTVQKILSRKSKTYAMFSRDDFKLALKGLDTRLSPRYSQPQPENKQKNMAQH